MAKLKKIPAQEAETKALSMPGRRGPRHGARGGVMTIPLDELKKLWEEFSGVPVDNDDNIERPFHVFEKGTDRLEIWKWFDEHCPNGLVKDLLGGMPKTGDHPVLEISCWSCSRSRSVPVCLGGKVYCRITGKQINTTWLAGQPRPDEPCNDYNPSRRSIYGCLIDWRLKRQKDKETT